jgi:hypothetical protein
LVLEKLKMHKRLSFFYTAFALVAVFLYAGCDPDRNDEPDDPPIDSNPQVTLISPANGYALARKGETVQIQFEIHDNELLTTWEAKEKWTSVTGVVYNPETRISGEYATISTNNEIRTISYTVPTGTAIQVYTTIEITAYATDNKGKVAKGKFRINVIPDVNDVTQYQIQSYWGDTIYSVLTGHDYAFDLVNRVTGDNQNMALPNMYIREASVGSTITWEFTSPIQGGLDSTIVTTDATRFNFDDLTYETTWQAFVTSNRIGNRSEPLSPGDVMILKLPTLPHFAIFRVVSTEGIGGCGCMQFDYKYSYQ